MADPRLLRKKRLENEYKELMELSKKSSIIEITPKGAPPYERYEVVFNIRTIISPTPTFRNQTVCTLTIPPNYPDAAPTMVAKHTPYPWHINWFQNGKWCFGHWNKEESLVNYIYRCARTLQFDPEIANPSSVANHEAIPFWNANKTNRRVIPSDTQALPTLDGPEQITIKPKPVQTPQIQIKQAGEKPRISIRK